MLKKIKVINKRKPWVLTANYIKIRGIKPIKVAYKSHEKRWWKCSKALWKIEVNYKERYLILISTFEWSKQRGTFSASSKIKRVYANI